MASQLFGCDPLIMAKAAEVALLDRPDFIDINMGCPAPKVIASGGGSALLKDIPLAATIVKEVKKAVDVPVTVKMRLGYDKDHIVAVDLAKAVEQAGADAITVHGRTREQMYAPSADPAICREVRDALNDAGFSSVILCGNGDIDSVEAAQRYISLGCDEVAIGRAALGAPWLFAALRDPDSFTPPTTEEIISTAACFVRDVVSDLGEEMGILESRGRAAHFIKGMRGSAAIRDRLNRATTLDEFLGVLADVGKA
jgi:nifR3 family TIM-barrel protein